MSTLSLHSAVGNGSFLFSHLARPLHHKCILLGTSGEISIFDMKLVPPESFLPERFISKVVFTQESVVVSYNRSKI